MLSFSRNYLLQLLVATGLVLYASLDLFPVAVRRSISYVIFSTILVTALGFTSKTAFSQVRGIHLKIAFFLIVVAYLPLMRALGWMFAYDSLIIAYLFLTALWIMAVTVNALTRHFMIERFHFLVYLFVGWTVIQSFLNVRTSDIVYTFGRFIQLPFQINYGLVSKSQNHFSLLIAGLMAFVAVKSRIGFSKLLIIVLTGILMLLMDSFFALVSLLFIVIFNKYIVKNNRLFLILLFSLPFIFLAMSEVVAGNLGISSERIITLNNRSHIWGGLIQYISRMDIVDWFIGNGYYGNFNEQTKSHYTYVFGKGFSGTRTAHSTVIQLFLDTGILGCVLVFHLLAQFYRRIKSENEYAIAGIVSVFLLGGFLESVFQMYDPVLFGLLLFAVLLVLGKPTEEEVPEYMDVE